jgi:hypothetical protein
LGKEYTVPPVRNLDLLTAAWRTGVSSVDAKGAMTEDMAAIFARFKKKRACRSSSEAICLATLSDAVRVAQAVMIFKRTKMGFSQPLPVRQYELLLALARDLERQFPKTDPFFWSAGCNLIEMEWAR